MVAISQAQEKASSCREAFSEPHKMMLEFFHEHSQFTCETGQVLHLVAEVGCSFPKFDIHASAKLIDYFFDHAVDFLGRKIA